MKTLLSLLSTTAILGAIGLVTPSTVLTEALWTAMVLTSRQYGALSNGWPSGFTQVTVDSNMIRAQ